MDLLQKKTLEVSRKYTYTYYTKSADAGQQTILLIHGWPDSAALWTQVIRDYLVPQGFGVVAIDCLGYAGTSKPTEPKEYNFKDMTQDLVDILDKEGLSKVISLGHDWGSALAGRLYNFHPDRCSGLVLLNVAYMVPSGEPFDLDKSLEATEKIFGRGLFWYWKVFGDAEGAKLLNSRVESVYTVAHGKPETWLDTFCKQDGMRNYLEEDRRQETEPYVTEELKNDFVERLSRDKFDAPQCWYRSMVNGHQDEANKSIKPEHIKVEVPFLYFGGTRDMVCVPAMLEQSKQAGLLPDVESVTVDCGHWSMLAKPTEFGEALTGWLKAKF